jgi:aspartate aminotransferase
MLIFIYYLFDPSLQYDVCRSLNFPAMLGDIEKAANGSLFVLHACAHNPTGCDPTTQQWDELSVLMKKKQHIAFFDSAYQGFASGDAEADAYAVRKFVEDGHQIILCQSFAKNFGLYGERVGLLSMVTQSAEETERVNSQMKRIVRAMYSNPPIHGARIVDTVLSDPVLRAQWREECKHMADRIKQMRVLLREKLEAGTGSPWQHITDQIGMFCFTGLDQTQVLRLREEFHIYCTEDGRFSMAGINVKNIDYLASSVVAVTAS